MPFQTGAPLDLWQFSTGEHNWGEKMNENLQEINDTIGALETAVNLPSGAANQVIATPDGAAGVSSLRALVEADIPDLSQSKITNLTTDLNALQLGLSTETSDRAAADTALDARVTAIETGEAGESSVAGADTEVQFNLAGALGADPLFTFDHVNKTLKLGPTSAAAWPPTNRSIFSYGASGIQRLAIGEIDGHYFGDNAEALHVFQNYPAAITDVDFPNMVELHARYQDTADSPSGTLCSAFITAQIFSPQVLDVLEGSSSTASVAVGGAHVHNLLGADIDASVDNSTGIGTADTAVALNLGVAAAATAPGTGLIGTGTGLDLLTVALNGNTITSLIGIHLETPDTSDGGEIGTMVGLQIDDWTNTDLYGDNRAILVTKGTVEFQDQFMLSGRFVDPTDQTKQAEIDLSNVASGAIRAINIPDQNSTTVQAKAAVLHQFLTGMTGQGLFSAAQPAFTDLSGSIAAAQLITPTASTLGGVKSLAAVANKFLTSIGTDGVPVAAQPAFSDLSGSIAAGQIPSGAVPWNQIGNATGALTLSNGAFGSVFQFTSPITWKWANITPATASVSQSSPLLTLSGRYWNGSVDTEDFWTLQNVLANGTNGTSLLTFTHSGSTGQAAAVFPAGAAGKPSLCFGSLDTGFWQATTTASCFQIGNNSSAGLVRFYGGAANFVNIGFNGSGWSYYTTQVPNTGPAILGSFSNGAGNACVTLGNNGGLTATAGIVTAVQIGLGGNSNGNVLFAPTSGTAKLVALNVAPTINQTGGANGDYTALQVNVVETAVGGTNKLLLDLQAGATGGLSRFTVDNVGNMKQLNATAATSSVSQSSPLLTLSGQYWNGSASAEDKWTIQNVLANGTNGQSTLTFTHTGTAGNAAVAFNVFTPAAVNTAGILLSNSWSVSSPNNGTTTALNWNGPSSGAGFNFYTGGNGAGNMTFASNSITLRSFATNQPNNIGISLGYGGGGNITATSGYMISTYIGGTFSPSAGTAAYYGLDVNFAVNQTGSASGNYTGLLVNIVETALLGTANLLLDLQAGVTGGVTQFSITNTGKIKVPTTNTAASATAGASGAPPSQVAGYLIVNIGGTDRKIPYYAV